MEINDKINVQDNFNPIGEISIYDVDGNLIASTHNMVVLGGRQLLIKMLYDAMTSTSNAASVSNFKLNFSYMTPNIKTTENLTYEMITDNESESDSYSVNLSSTNTTLDVSTGKASITMIVTVSGTDSFTKFNQLYITYENNDTTTLFSRAVTNPTFIGASGKLTIKYVIYM